MICHKELQIKINIKRYKKPESRCGSPVLQLMPKYAREAASGRSSVCTYIQHTAVQEKIFSLTLLSELWKAGPDRMLV